MATGGNSQCSKYVLAWTLVGALGEACRSSLLHVLALPLGVAWVGVLSAGATSAREVCLSYACIDH